MRFYSDYTKKFYNTPDECEKEERAFLQEKETTEAAREAKMKHIEELQAKLVKAEEAIDVAVEARNAIHNELSKAVVDYHKEYKTIPVNFSNLNDFFKFLFN